MGSSLEEIAARHRFIHDNMLDEFRVNAFETLMGPVRAGLPVNGLTILNHLIYLKAGYVFEEINGVKTATFKYLDDGIIEQYRSMAVPDLLDNGKPVVHEASVAEFLEREFNDAGIGDIASRYNAEDINEWMDSIFTEGSHLVFLKTQEFHNLTGENRTIRNAYFSHVARCARYHKIIGHYLLKKDEDDLPVFDTIMIHDIDEEDLQRRINQFEGLRTIVDRFIVANMNDRDFLGVAYAKLSPLHQKNEHLLHVSPDKFESYVERYLNVANFIMKEKQSDERDLMADLGNLVTSLQQKNTIDAVISLYNETHPLASKYNMDSYRTFIWKASHSLTEQQGEDYQAYLSRGVSQSLEFLASGDTLAVKFHDAPLLAKIYDNIDNTNTMLSLEHKHWLNRARKINTLVDAVINKYLPRAKEIADAKGIALDTREIEYALCYAVQHALDMLGEYKAHITSIAEITYRTGQLTPLDHEKAVVEADKARSKLEKAKDSIITSGIDYARISETIVKNVGYQLKGLREQDAR